MVRASTQAYLAFLGANVRRQRLARGLTQLELSEALEMDLRFLQRIESGQVNLRFDSFVRLAEQLGVTPASLLRRVRVHEKKRGRPRKLPGGKKA